MSVLHQNKGRFFLTASWGRGSRLLALAALVLSGCMSLSSTGPSGQNSWLQSGQLALSRPVPARNLFNSSTTTSVAALSAPQIQTDDGMTPTVVVSRTDKTLTALRPGQPPLVFKAEGSERLREGSYSITLKEENPLWYAPSSYFTKRALRVPSEGSRERFKRAALGSKSLFLNDQTPIHSGPVWMEEIGGLRLSQDQMAQLFSSIQVGTRVEVR